MEETRQLNAIAEQLVRRVGLDYRGGRLPLLVSSVRRRMALRDIPTVSEYIDLLNTDEKEWEHFVNTVSVTETAFYRQPDVVEAVTRVLPALHRARPAEDTIHIWSTATAEGQEAYTLAMAALESGVPALRPLIVWGSDVNTEALARARAACYPCEDMASLPADWRNRYVDCLDEGMCTPVQRVRRLVRFFPFNLMDLLAGKTPPFRPDIIVCANVLIYFEADTARKVMAALAALLPKDGVLFFDKAVAYLAREVLKPIQVDDTYAYRALPESARGESDPNVRPSSARSKEGAHSGTVKRREKSFERRQQKAPPPPPPHDAPPEQEADVVKLMDAGQWEEAESRLLAWRARSPLDVRPHFLLARLYRIQGRWQEARRCYEQALYLQPSLAVAHLEYGNLLRMLGDVRGARRAYRRALHAVQTGSKWPQFGLPEALVRRLAARALKEMR